MDVFSTLEHFKLGKFKWTTDDIFYIRGFFRLDSVLLASIEHLIIVILLWKIEYSAQRHLNWSRSKYKLTGILAKVFFCSTWAGVFGNHNVAYHCTYV